jgi:CRISPR-associated protein Cmr5
MIKENSHTLGQERAAQALSSINVLKNEEFKGKFASYVERLPAAIVMNGLGQAIASELAASRLNKDKRGSEEKAHERLFNLIQEWFGMSKVYENSSSDANWLMKSILEGSQEDYVRAQAEALAYLDWLKMFSQAYLKGGDDDSSDLQD